MTILSWPSGLPAPNSLSIAPAANTQSGGRSPFDGTEQTLQLPGTRWIAELRFVNLAEAEWRVLGAFLADLGGKAGRFTWSPIARFPRRGTASPGTPRVNGGAQTGKTLVTDGWGGAGTAFAVGDFLAYTDPAGRATLHRVTADASVSSGAATISIAPPIRRSPADNALIDLAAPSCVWKLSRDDVMEDHEPGERGFSVTIPIEEAIW
jgi:hypothetical protein